MDQENPNNNVPQNPGTVPPKETAYTQPTQQVAPQFEQQPSIAPVPEPVKKPKTLLFVILGVLFAAAIGVVLYLFVFSSESDTSDSSSTSTVETVKNEIPVLNIGIQSDNILNELPENDNFYSTTMSIFYQTHEGLVASEKLTQIKPRIAESWTNPDDLTWVFKIAGDRTFHTGKKLTAKDVVASLMEAKDSGYWDSAFATISSITLDPSDDSAVIVKTATPDSVLLNRLVIIPIYDIDYEPGQSWASGTGAYTLKPDVAPTAESLVLVADDNYPLGKPMVREVVYTNHSDDETYLSNIVAGKFDIANIESLQGNQLSEAQNLKITRVKSLGSFFASLNNDRPSGPLTDIRVREALSHIIQGQEFVDKADSEVATQIVPQEVPGYSTEVEGYAYDLDKAKRLLVEAGFATPKDLTVKVGYFKGAQDADAEILIAQLEAAGITVVVDAVDNGGDFVKAINDEQYDIMLYSYSTGIYDLTDMALDIAGSASLYNQYENPKIDELVAEANAEFDQAKRLDKLQTVNMAIAEDFGIIPLRTSVYNLVYKDNIDCEQDNGTEYPCYFWKTTSNK